LNSHRHQLETVIPTEPDVDDHEVRVLLHQQLGRLFQRTCTDRPVAALRKEDEQPDPGGLVIFDDQNGPRHRFVPL